ncbi:MAG: hypothetical protein ABUM51_07140 [Bacteroidota bacterium]
MHILLFIFYSFVGGYALTRIPFFRNSGIKPAVLLVLLGLRVAAGCLHNVIAYRYYPNHGDIWLFFNHSFNTRRELFTDFHTFWADNSAWADLPHNLIEWMHLIFNFLSFDNLYINTLLFSFLTFAGAIALFRVFVSRFPNDPLSAFCVLLLPSILFWTACIHTEGILYTILGFFFFILNRLLAGGGSIRRVLLCLFLYALAVFFRPAILVGLLPATLFWIGAEGSHRRRRFLLLTGAATLLLLLLIPHLSSLLLQHLSARQQEFQALAGNSRIYLPALDSTWSGLGRVLPWALLNGFFQPLPGSGGQTIYWAFAAELLLIWAIIAIALMKWVFSHQKGPLPWLTPGANFGFSCLLFSILGMLLIGYIIPFVGSIIRYRSLYLPFLVAPFLHVLRQRGLPSNLNSWLKRKFLKS